MTTATQKNETPPYCALYEQLLERIKNKEITNRIPSINVLASECSVSVATVKKAIDRLKNQNIIYGQKGKAIFVNPKAFSSPLFQWHIVIFFQEELCKNSFYLKVISELRSILEKEQCVMHFVNSNSQLVNARGIDILLVMDLEESSRIEEIRNIVEPAKTVYLNSLSGQTHNIATDNRLGGYLAIEYLYEKGHRHIGLISRDVELSYSFFHQRYLGVKEFVRTHPDLVIVNHSLSAGAGTCDEKDGYQGAKSLIENNPGITAIFAFTDILALGIYNYCNRNSIAIPDAISVIGFDDKEFAELIFPALTTIREDHISIAGNIDRIMGEIASGGNSTHEIFCEPVLICRDSVRKILHPVIKARSIHS